MELQNRVEVKVSRYRLQKYGRRGAFMSVPKVWLTDNGLGPGDWVDIYSDEWGRLIVKPASNQNGGE